MTGRSLQAGSVPLHHGAVAPVNMAAGSEVVGVTGSLNGARIWFFSPTEFLAGPPRWFRAIGYAEPVPDNVVSVVGMVEEPPQHPGVITGTWVIVEVETP